MTEVSYVCDWFCQIILRFVSIARFPCNLFYRVCIGLVISSVSCLATEVWQALRREFPAQKTYRELVEKT